MQFGQRLAKFVTIATNTGEGIIVQMGRGKPEHCGWGAAMASLERLDCSTASDQGAQTSDHGLSIYLLD